MSLPRIPRYVQLMVKNKISVFSLFYLFLVKKYDEGNSCVIRDDGHVFRCKNGLKLVFIGYV